MKKNENYYNPSLIINTIYLTSYFPFTFMSFNPTFKPKSVFVEVRRNFDRCIEHGRNNIAVIWETLSKPYYMSTLLFATTTERHAKYDKSIEFLRDYILSVTLKYYTRIHTHDYTKPELLQLLPEFHQNHLTILVFVRALRKYKNNDCYDYLSSAMASVFDKFLSQMEDVPTNYYIRTGHIENIEVQSGTDRPIRRSIRLLTA